LTIKVCVVEPREDLLRRFDAEVAMAEAATTAKVKRSHQDRAMAYRVAIELFDAYVRCTQPTIIDAPEFVEMRTLDEIRDEVQRASFP
jgi:hypothetical protein